MLIESSIEVTVKLIFEGSHTLKSPLQEYFDGPTEAEDISTIVAVDTRLRPKHNAKEFIRFNGESACNSTPLSHTTLSKTNDDSDGELVPQPLYYLLHELKGGRVSFTVASLDKILSVLRTHLGRLRSLLR